MKGRSSWVTGDDTLRVTPLGSALQGVLKTQIALWALGDRSSQHILHLRGRRLSLDALFPGTANRKLSGHDQGSLDSLPERSRNALDLSTKASIPA